jgi:hypothetical protein
MTPIDKIKEGILGNDMEQVIQGFKLLTGEEIRPERGNPEEPSAEPIAKEAVQPPMQVRAKDLDFSTKPREEESKYGKREPIVVGENQFIDDGTEDTDVTTPDVGRTTRRPPVKMVEVQCHACGGKEMINAQYKSGEFHRCGKCVGV